MPPAAVCLVSWLVPGAGHLLLGRRQKALVFFAALLAMFAIGLSLEGRLFPFEFSQPLVGHDPMDLEEIGRDTGPSESLAKSFGIAFLTGNLANVDGVFGVVYRNADLAFL